MKKTSWLLSLYIVAISQFAFAQTSEMILEQKGPSQKTIKDNHLFQISGGINSLSSNIASESGLLIGIDYFHAFTPLWAAKLGIGQGLNTGLEVLTTDISLEASYAFKGAHYQEGVLVQAANEDIADIKALPIESYLLNAGLKQSFYNGSTSILPLTGFTGSFIWRFASDTKYSGSVGAGLDYTLNGENTLLAIKVYAGMNIPLFD